MTDMTNERKEELGNRFLMIDLENFTEEMSIELLRLELQEIIFLVSSARYYVENDAERSAQFHNKEKVFYIAAVEKIKNAEKLYVAYSKVTGYPFFDADGNIWMFSKQELADGAVGYYMQQMIMLEIREIKSDSIMKYFALFYEWGMEQILMDNGQFSLVVKRSDILAPPDFSNVPEIKRPLMNAKLNKSMIEFFQNINTQNNYEGRDVILQKMEFEMLQNITDAKYLVAMRLIENAPSGQDENGIKVIKEDAQLEFANIMDQNDNSVWLPVFTDWEEFAKAFDKQEWGVNILAYVDLEEISKNCTGFVINPYGIGFKINQETKSRIDEIIN